VLVLCKSKRKANLFHSTTKADAAIVSRVMLLLKQLIALCLSASFVVSGFAGLSPLLHVLIEHGGRGPLHVHHHNAPIKARSSFVPASAKGIRVSVRPATLSTRLMKLPQALLGGVWHNLIHALADDETGTPVSAPATHHHDSLAQSLASGGVAVALGGMPVIGAPARAVLYVLSSDAFRTAGEFQSHRFGRGPPAPRG